MATAREIPCVYYEYENCCSKGKKGTFWEACQICKKYKARKDNSSVHRNFKKQKMEKIKRRDMDDMMRDY